MFYSLITGLLTFIKAKRPVNQWLSHFRLGAGMSVELWKEVFSNVRENVDTYLSSEEIRSTYRDPNTSVEFVVDDLCHSVNAFAGKVAVNSYRIRICAGLAAYLRESAIETIESGWVFKDQSSSDPVLRSRLIDYLMYIWLDFVCFHEWSHVICGHQSVGSSGEQWSEFEVQRDAKGKLPPEVNQRLEAEADAYAAKFTLARFSTIWQGLAQEIYAKAVPEMVLRDYLMSVLLLFRAFEKIDRKDCAERSHPEPIDRAFVVHSFMMGEFSGIPGLPSLGKEEVETIFSGVLLEFYLSHLGLNSETLLPRLLQSAEFMASVDDMLKKLKMHQYRVAVRR
jgi:hypothetical protein